MCVCRRSRTFSSVHNCFPSFVSKFILLFYFNPFLVLSRHIDMEWYKVSGVYPENKPTQRPAMTTTRGKTKEFYALKKRFSSSVFFKCWNSCIRCVKRIETYFAYFCWTMHVYIDWFGRFSLHKYLHWDSASDFAKSEFFFHLLLLPLPFEIERLSDDTMKREINQYQKQKKEKKKT